MSAAGGMFGLQAGPAARLRNKQLRRVDSAASVSSRGSARSLTSLYDRDKDWKQRREARSREAKKARADAEMLECTFSPSTNRVQVATGRQIVAKVKIKLRAAAYTAGGVDFERLFRHYDRDNSGSLDFEEFRSAMRRDAKVAKRDVSDTELKQVFGSVDIDGGGEIDIDEFVAWINADDKPEDIVLETPSPRRRRRPRPTAPATGEDSPATPTHEGNDDATAADDSPPTPASRSRRRKKPAKVQARELQRKQVPDTPLVKQVKIKLKAAAYTSNGMDFQKLFGFYDRDNSGSLELPEFISAIRRDAKMSPQEVSDEEVKDMFDSVDDDGGGEVEIDEFVAWLNSNTSGMVVKKKKKKRRRAKPRTAFGRSRSRSKKRSTSPRASLANTPTGLTSFRQFFGPGSRSPGTAGKDDAAAKAEAPAESELVRKVKSKLRAAAYTSGGVDYAKLFKHYDRDNSGSLEFDEFRSALRRDAKIKVTDVSDLDLREVFNTVDEDGGGEVEIDEFVAWLGRTGAPKVTVRKRSPKKKKVVAAAGGKSKGNSNTTPATPPGGGAGRVKKVRKPDTPLVKAVKQKLRAAAYTSKGMDFARLFQHYDRDNSGAIDFNEFRSAIRRDAKITANQVSDHALRKVFNTVDDDGGGEVEIDEFVEWLGVDGRTSAKPKPKAAVPPPAPAATDDAPPVPPPGKASGGGSKKGAAKKKKKKRRVDSPLVKAVKIKLRAAAYTSKGMDFARLFKHYDRDNSGALDFNEFRSAIRRDAKITANQVSDKELQRVFNSVDDDGGGEVEIDEFVEWLGLSGPKQTPKQAASGDEDEEGGEESPRRHRHRHRHRRHHSPRNAGSEHGTDAEEVAASVAVDEEAGLDTEAAAADARRLEAARAALWDDVFEVPDDLLVHSGNSHALKQQLQQVKQRLQTAPAPWDAQTHERRASVGSAADSEPSRARSHGGNRDRDRDRDAASSARRGGQRDRRSDRSSRSPEGDSSTIAAANGDHLAYLESQYAALFGQDGKVASTLRDLGVLQSPVLQQQPNGTKAKAGATGERHDSDGATTARPSATASAQPADATTVPPPAPESKASTADAQPPPPPPPKTSTPARASMAARPSMRLIGTPADDAGIPAPQPSPPSHQPQGATAEQALGLRQEISRLKQHHRAKVAELQATHEAELEAAQRAPSEAQTAEYKALMDRFVHSEEERARLFVSLSAAQRQLQHLQKVNSDTQARSLQLQASLASSGATPAPKLRAEDRVRVEDSVIAAAVQRETAELRGQMEGVLTDNGLLKARLAAAEAALQAVNGQRDDLTTERAAWLEQLQQENLQLRHVYEEARRAKERLVEEMNDLAKQRETLDEERLQVMERAASVASSNHHRQLAIRDRARTLSSAGGRSESGIDDELPATAPRRDSVLSDAVPEGARRLEIDGVIVEVRNADGMPTALSDQGAVELLARHQVEAFKQRSRADKLEATTNEAKRAADQAASDVSAARAETAAARQEVGDLRKQYDEQLAGLEERLTQRIKDLESRNRLLRTSLGVVKKANRQLKLQNAVATTQRQ